jgi:predicted nucleic acid-binding Zn ribbon protein
MEQAKDILKTAIRKLKDPEAAPAWLAANWPLIVGDRVAGHTRPVALQNAIFRIQADSAAWKRQVDSMGATICERVNRAWGGILVRRLRVEQAPQHAVRLSYEEDNQHTPFVRGRNKRDHENQ